MNWSVWIGVMSFIAWFSICTVFVVDQYFRVKNDFQDHEFNRHQKLSKIQAAESRHRR